MFFLYICPIQLNSKKPNPMLTRPISTYTLDDELISYDNEQEPDTSYLMFVTDVLYANYAANNLKKEQFMKSPLVIYNHCFVKNVIEVAYALRQQLEREAQALHARGGPYIRPVALFVINGSNALHDLALLELKTQFMEAGIRKAEIKIKGNTIDELQGVDMMRTDCEVRYVIMVNDLCEEWRCPFAYVLASLGSRPLVMDLVMPANCLLPQEHRVPGTHSLLNAGYVLTASSKFPEITAELRSHFHDLGMNDTNIRIQDNLIELLKNISIFEILREEINNGMESINFKKEKKNERVVMELKRLARSN
jgi:hypothetical protein